MMRTKARMAMVTLLRRWMTLDPLPVRWRMPVFFVGGIAMGSALVVAHISRAGSYLLDKPDACINCHVMNQAYASWQHSSHREVAVCTDCHLPHQNPVAKLAFKGRDGLRHSYVFTFRLEPQVLRLSEGAVPVVQENCLRCHHDQLQMVRVAGVDERRCWDCHENIHGPQVSLSAAPHARRPALPSAGLEWMKGESAGSALTEGDRP